MQIAIPADSEETARIIALNAAQWFYDCTQTEPDSAGDVIDMAGLFEHYLTQGQTIAFDCQDTLKKTIRG